MITFVRKSRDGRMLLSLRRQHDPCPEVRLSRGVPRAGLLREVLNSDAVRVRRQRARKYGWRQLEPRPLEQQGSIRQSYAAAARGRRVLAGRAGGRSPMNRASRTGRGRARKRKQGGGGKSGEVGARSQAGRTRERPAPRVHRDRERSPGAGLRSLPRQADRRDTFRVSADVFKYGKDVIRA